MYSVIVVPPWLRMLALLPLCPMLWVSHNLALKRGEKKNRSMISVPI